MAKKRNSNTCINLRLGSVISSFRKEPYIISQLLYFIFLYFKCDGKNIVDYPISSNFVDIFTKQSINSVRFKLAAAFCLSWSHFNPTSQGLKPASHLPHVQVPAIAMGWEVSLPWIIFLRPLL